MPAGYGVMNLADIGYLWHRTCTPRHAQRYFVHSRQNSAYRLSTWKREVVTKLGRLHKNVSISQVDRLASIVDRIEREGRHAC